MGELRRSYSAKFKAKVALTALQEKNTLEELSSKYQLTSGQIVRWKKEATEKLSILFERKKDKEIKEKEEIIEDLYKQLGMLKMEYEWLKKKLTNIEL